MPIVSIEALRDKYVTEKQNQNIIITNNIKTQGEVAAISHTTLGYVYVH